MQRGEIRLSVAVDVLPLTWGTISLVISAIMVASGIVVSALLWVYRELNSLRSDLSSFRIQVAQDYVSTGAIKHFEERFEKSFQRLVDRVDRAIELALRNSISAQKAED